MKGCVHLMEINPTYLLDGILSKRDLTVEWEIPVCYCYYSVALCKVERWMKYTGLSGVRSTLGKFKIYEWLMPCHLGSQVSKWIMVKRALGIVV